MDNQPFVCGGSGGDEVRCTYYSEKDGGVKGASPREVLVMHQVDSDVAQWLPKRVGRELLRTHKPVH